MIKSEDKGLRCVSGMGSDGSILNRSIIKPGLYGYAKFEGTRTVFLGAAFHKTEIPQYTVTLDRGGRFEHCQEGRDFTFVTEEKE